MGCRVKCSQFSPCYIVKNYMIGKWVRDQNGYLIDLNTKKSYAKDSPNLIRQKCVGVFFGNIPRTIVQIFYEIGMLLWNIAKIAAMTLWNFGKEFCAACRKRRGNDPLQKNHSFKHAFAILGKGLFATLPKKFGIHLWHVVRCPLLGLAIEAGSLYGIADPNNGRKIIAESEKAWNNGVHHDDGGFYLASCMQPRPASPSQLIRGGQPIPGLVVIPA